MDLAAAYLVKSAVVTAVLYIFMKLLMERENLHGYIRFLWLASIVLSLIVPAVVVDLGAAAGDALYRVREIILPEILVGGSDGAEAAAAGRSFPLVPVLYFSGMAVTALFYLLSYIKVRRIISSCHPADAGHVEMVERLCREAGISGRARLLISDSEVSPFSRFNDIVISRKDADSPEIREILMHELAHIGKRHSLDLVLAELFTLIQWFNPCAWLTKASLSQIHEYSADRFVLDHGANMYEYQLLLIKKAVGPRFHSIANSLNHSNLKNRITMMEKSKPKTGAILKSMLALPVSAMLIMLFNAGDSMAIDKVTQIVPFEQTVQTMPDTVTLLQTDVRPKFRDSDLNAFASWVLGQMKYPEECAKSRIEGKVNVQFTVTSEGKLKDIKILESPDERMSEEVLRVFAMSPDWTPGIEDGKKVDVTMVMPVVFRLC